MKTGRSALVVLLGLVSGTAYGHPMACSGDRDGMRSVFESRGLTDYAVGVEQFVGLLTEVLVDEKTGDWAILLTLPDATQTCVLAMGEGWQETPRVIPGSDS